MGFDNEQDIRRMGSLIKVFPFFQPVLYLFGFGISLLDFLLLRGSYSKDSIFEHLYVSWLPHSFWCLFYVSFGFLFNCCVIQYVWYFLVFFDSPLRLSSRIWTSLMKLRSWMITLFLYCLFFSIFIGYLTRGFFYWFRFKFFWVRLF